MPRKRELVKRAAKVAEVVGALPAPDRARLLHLAGYNETRLVAVLQRAIDVLNRKLDARKPERLVVPTGTGACEVRVFDDDDTVAQIRSATELLSILGAYPSKNVGVSSGNGKQEIVIKFAEMPATVRPSSVMVDGVEVVLPANAA